MKVKSEVTGIEFWEENCVFYRNIRQSIYFLQHGAKLIDLFLDGKNKLVFVFTKDTHRKLMPLWMANKYQEEDYDKVGVGNE